MSKYQIFPKCLAKTRARAFTAEGFIVPCCWCDHPEFMKDNLIAPLFKSSLNIDTIEDIEKDVINSPEWEALRNVLENHPDQAPLLCKQMCGQPVKNAVREKIRIENGETDL